MNKKIHIIIGCCAVLFCAASFYIESAFTAILPTAVIMNQPQDYDTCGYLSAWIAARPDDAEQARKQYDTLRLYIEKCGASDSESYNAFRHIDYAVSQYAPNDTTRFDRYRDWLISVLFLNKTQPLYFCNCLESIAGTFQYWKTPTNDYLAVLNYLRHLPACDNAGIEKQYRKSMDYLREKQMDTTLPSLDDLGLGFLDSLGLGTHRPSTPSNVYLSSFTSNPNPFIKETALEFKLNRMAYVTVEVFDELGRMVFGEGRGYSLEAGLHQIHLDGKSLPRGTLCARISTGFGEVKTVKLIHE